MTKPRAALYLRQSTYREESISLELQEHTCREYAERQGYEVVALESDPGISGRTWNRPGVQKVMELVETKQADVVVLWKWSRLSRSRLDWAVAADKVDTLGGRIESATEQVDISTSTGRLARGMLTEFAAFESERIGDSWKETHARRIRNGLPHSASRRFGYTYSKDTGYTIDPVQGPVLREMYLRFTRGDGLKEVGEYAAGEGFEPETGWRTGTIRRLLDRGFGAGYLWVKGELVSGAHEGVITEAEWLAYRVRREARAGRPRSESTDYAYTGLLKCFCGGSMGGGFVRRGEKVYRRYTCIESQQKRTHDVITVSEPQIERAVLAWLEEVAVEVNELAASHVSRPASDNLDRKAAQIAADLKKNAARTDTLLVKYLDDEVSAEVYARMTAKLAEEKAALEARQRMLQVNVTVRPSAIVPDLLAQWDQLTERSKRKVLATLLAEIRLHDWEDGVRKGFRRLDVIPVWDVVS